MKAFKGGLFGCFGVGAALIVVAIILVAIGNAGKSNGANTGASATATASGSPTPTPTPLVFSGRGSKVTAPFTLTAGSYRVTWTASGAESNFIVHVHGAESTHLINEVPPNPSSGEALFDAGGGQYFLEIDASNLTWTITFARM